MSDNVEKDECIVTTGTFDGVHRGHRLLLETLKAEGAERGLRPVAFTFDRHPLEIIAPDRAPGLLLTPEERDRRLRAEGVEVVELRFDEEMRHMTAAEWMKRLHDRFGARALVLGYDNTFGSDGMKMPVAGYVRIGAELGVDVLQAPVLPGLSSSAVRTALAEGDMDLANDMLGYPWTLRGPVTYGRQVGRDLGFPTANLALDHRILLPKSGVYASMVEMPDGSARPGVTNIGVRPSFDDAPGMSVETFIPGFEGNLYGREIAVRPLKRMRGERKFEDIADLQRRIARDVEECMALIGAPAENSLSGDWSSLTLNCKF